MISMTSLDPSIIGPTIIALAESPHFPGGSAHVKHVQGAEHEMIFSMIGGHDNRLQ
jgi:hypothetical protein